MMQHIYIENMPVEKPGSTSSAWRIAVFKWENEYVDVLESLGRVGSSAVLARRSSPIMLLPYGRIAVKSS